MVRTQGGLLPAADGCQTDFDGHCFIKGLVPGRYDLEVTYVGYRKLIVNVDVEPARFTKVFAELHPSAVQLNEIMVVDSRTPLIDIGGPENGIRISEEEDDEAPVERYVTGLYHRCRNFGSEPR